jgi:hypothetical protein
VLSFTYPLVTFGLPEWENFSNLETEYLLNIRLHILSNSFIDYQQNDVKDFIIKYRERYKTEPDEYAFAGYDNAMFYLNALRLFGKDFQNCLKDYHPNLLQTDLDFEHQEGSGWENKNVLIYRYENFKKIDAVLNPLKTVGVNIKENK